MRGARRARAPRRRRQSAGASEPRPLPAWRRERRPRRRAATPVAALVAQAVLRRNRFVLLDALDGLPRALQRRASCPKRTARERSPKAARRLWETAHQKRELTSGHELMACVSCTPFHSTVQKRSCANDRTWSFFAKVPGNARARRRATPLAAILGLRRFSPNRDPWRHSLSLQHERGRTAQDSLSARYGRRSRRMWLPGLEPFSPSNSSGHALGLRRTTRGHLEGPALSANTRPARGRYVPVPPAARAPPPPRTSAFFTSCFPVGKLHGRT
jgi:hypothetical protein